MAQKATLGECKVDNCDGQITDGPDAADLPADVTWKACDECGQRYEFDTSVGSLRCEL